MLINDEQFFFAQLFVTIEMNLENAIKGKKISNISNLDLVFISYSISLFFSKLSSCKFELSLKHSTNHIKDSLVIKSFAFVSNAKWI